MILKFERFLETASGCIGEHLHGEELTQPEMEYISKGELFTATLGTCFVAATSRLTEEKKLRVGSMNSESLCTCILVENTLLEYTERERSRMRAHTSYSPCVPRDIHCISAKQKARCRKALAASAETS